MPIVMLRLPEIEETPNDRPRHCPYCGSQILQRWGRVSKSIQDTQVQNTEVHRYRCSDCKRTFRDYPEGIDRSNQSLRIRHLAALAWAMGLSCRDVVRVFDELGVRLSRMSVWRDGQEMANRLGSDENGMQRFSIERIHADKAPKRPGVVIVIDPGNGKPVLLGKLDEHNPREVKRWLEPLFKEIEIEVATLETDLLEHYQLTQPNCLQPEIG